MLGNAVSSASSGSSVGTSGRPAQVNLLRSTRLAPAVRRRGRGSVVTNAFMSADPASLEASVGAASALLTTLCAGAALYIMTQPAPGAEQSGYEEREACPQCNGSGFEPCVCTRWSSDGQGCASCNRRGVMRCRACGGGGKAQVAHRLIKMDTVRDTTSNY